jgi:hypothetical protein
MAGDKTNPMAINMSESFKTEVEVVISDQAKSILSHTKYSEKDFLAWALFDRKITLGGHDACLFLEKKARSGN